LLGVTQAALSKHSFVPAPITLLPSSSEAAVTRAWLPKKNNNLSARVASLRARLAAGEGYLAHAPAVFTSVDQTKAKPNEAAASPTLSETVSQSSQPSRLLQWCDHTPPAVDLSAWPVAKLKIIAGQRVLQSTTTQAVVVGETTLNVPHTVTHAALPIRTARSLFTACLDSPLIGVTLNGGPSRNDTFYRHLNTTSQTPMGHTRDGFTVSGAVSHEAALDECGGQYVQNKYQYHLRPSEPFIIGCYAGLPAPLNL